ncbi:MAG TPA: hypothetical protein VMY41_11350 [Thermohalobaculum sp.]|nr:hypothetical protein [Thermohalobaculum sp.]
MSTVEIANPIAGPVISAARVGGVSAFGFWRRWMFARDGIAAFATWSLRGWSAGGKNEPGIPTAGSLDR